MARSSILRSLPPAVVTAAIGAVTVGCSTPDSPKPRRVSLAEFAPSAADEALETADPAGSEADAAAGALDDGWDDLFDDGSDRAPLRPLAPGERMIVDSMVGQVNGQPVFADSFFVPIEDELVALSSELNQREFAIRATEIVSAELQQVVLNALFLAEAQADLSQQEQIGLLQWSKELQERLTAVFGGTESEADRKLREQEGKTLDSHLREIKDQALIQRLIEEEIGPRVIVSWRDIEREYQRQYDRYNPPPTITLGRIRLATERQTVPIAAVAQRLADGEDFVAIAESLDQPNGGIWLTVEPGTAHDEISNETVRAQLDALSDQGDTTDAFEVGRSTWWLSIIEVERPPGRSLYDPDVQRQLASYIRNVRLTEEQNRFIQSLLDRGIYDELDTMADRLIAIAILRYGP